MHTKSKLGPAIFSCRQISKNYGQLEILKDVSFSIHKGEKIGLVGPNGSGKSTLLKILANVMEADSGRVTKSKEITTSYFPQVHEGDGLSGGELAKKVLQPLMATPSDVYLLDEPTNNLDVEGLEELEKFVLKSESAFLIISHDRRFLDNTVTKIIEIEPQSKNIVIYDGNYSDFAKERQSRISRAWNTYTDAEQKSNKLSREIEQRLSWMKKIEQKRKNIKKLPVHEKEKPEAAVLRDKEARAGRRARIIKDKLEVHLEQMSDITKPVRELPLKINFEPFHGSTKVFTIENIKKKMGEKTIGPVSMYIQYGDRIQVTGPNGAGKTTFIRMLIGEIKPDFGVISKGENVQIGYIGQKRQVESDSRTALAHFLESTEVDETNSRKILHRFRITTEDVNKKLNELSPGEYSRVIVAELLAIQPNCILLDEPSNHLDLEILEELEEALKTYNGTLIVVSHDRYFVDEIGLQKEISLN